MSILRNTRTFHWLFLFWIGMVYIWGLWGVTMTSGLCSGRTVFILYNFHPGAPDPFLLSNLVRAGLFTLFIVLFAAALWAGLSQAISRRFFWLYFLIEGGLALTCSITLNQVNIALSLSLALVLAAIVILQQPRQIVSVALECIALFLVAWLLEGGISGKASQSGFFWIIAIGTLPGYLAMILFVVGYILLYLQQVQSQAQLSLAYAELEQAHTELTISAERIEELTRLTERQRLARELHDTFAQGLTGLLMQLEAIRAGLQSQRYLEAQEMVEQSLIGARAALADTRGAIDDLRTDEIEPARLPAIVQQEIAHFTEASGIPCRAELTALAHVPAPLCEQILRMISEGLTNIARHAQAEQAAVRSDVSADTLMIEIQDDGQGFDPACNTARAGHYGLLGLHERARMVGGEFSIESAPGKGTLLRLSIPLTRSDEPIASRSQPQTAPDEYTL